MYRVIEAHCFDAVNGGYHEVLTRDWKPIVDMRLSNKDENGDKTMNSHLHILEPYTNLYRVWKDEHLKEQLIGLLHVFTNKLMNKKTHHLDLSFDTQWHGKRNIKSYGHDIEASCLITETVQVLGDKEKVLGDKVLGDKIMTDIFQIAHAAEEGIQPDGSMINEHFIDEDRYDCNRGWWVQCGNVIGEINLAQLYLSNNSKDNEAKANAVLQKASLCLQYIVNNLVDNEHGELYWGIRPDGTPNTDDDHAGFWKCPYHNTRMCLEIITRNF